MFIRSVKEDELKTCVFVTLDGVEKVAGFLIKESAKKWIIQGDTKERKFRTRKEGRELLIKEWLEFKGREEEERERREEERLNQDIRDVLSIFDESSEDVSLDFSVTLPQRTQIPDGDSVVPGGLPESLHQVYLLSSPEERISLQRLVKKQRRRNRKGRFGSIIRKTEFFILSVVQGATIRELSKGWALLNPENEREQDKRSLFRSYVKTAKVGNFGPDGVRGNPLQFDGDYNDPESVIQLKNPYQDLKEWIEEVRSSGKEEKIMEVLAQVRNT